MWFLERVRKLFPGFFIGSVFVSTYGICAAVGLLIGFAPALIRYKKETDEYLPLFLVCAWTALGAMVGMHLLFGLTNISRWGTLFSSSDFGEFLNTFTSIFGGSVFYGGLLGGLIAGTAAVRIMRLPRDTVTDCLAPAVAVFHGFARIGCFFAGCCYGVKWEHGVTFGDSVAESANGVPRVPVQLLEAGFEFLLGGMLWLLLLKFPKTRGKLLALYLTVYSAGRFFLEFLRGDEYRGFIGALSTSQFIGIFVFAFGLGMLLRGETKKSAE